MSKITKSLLVSLCAILAAAMSLCASLSARVSAYTGEASGYSASGYSYDYAGDTAAESGVSSFFIIVPILLLLILPYFIPSIVAKCKKHNNFTAILLLNIFLGWTFIGWVICLVWAFKKPSQPPVYQIYNYNPNENNTNGVNNTMGSSNNKEK